MILFSILLLALPLPGSPGPDGSDEIVRLLQGRMLVGEIVRHDLDGFTLVSARTGGRFELQWKDLFPGEAVRLKRHLGYRTDFTEPMVPATRLLLVNGKEIVGRVLRRSDSQIEIRTREQSVVVPRFRLSAPPETVAVPATQVLTPEQFYQERVPEIDSKHAQKEYEFALELRTVFALDRAMEHLQKARELADSEGRADLVRRIAGTEEELRRTLANRAEAEALDHVRQLMHRGRFIQAREELDSFPERYPDSALRGQYVALKERFGKARTDAMEVFLARNWFNAAVGIVQRASLEKDKTVQQRLDWAQSELPRLVREKLLSGLKGIKAEATVSELESLWQARFRHSPKSHQASYGDGSWILGEERARAGIDAPEKKKDDGKTPEQRELEERMQRYLQNLQRAQKRESGDSEETPEDWWRDATTTRRFQFLLAYYAEFSGDYKIVLVGFQDCPTCGGTGLINVLDLTAGGSRTHKVECPQCHTVGVYRLLTFR